MLYTLYGRRKMSRVAYGDKAYYRDLDAGKTYYLYQRRAATLPYIEWKRLHKEDVQRRLADCSR